MASSTASVDRVGTQSFGDSFVGMLKLVGGPSSLNPTGMKQNCVSVTFAKIMEYPTVNEFWYAIFGTLLEDRGMKDHEIEDLLNRTKWQVRRKTYTSNSECSAYHQQLYDIAKWSLDGLGPRQAAIYTRPDGTRHCVVAAPDFTCYQHNDEGIKVTKELKQAKSIVMYGLRCAHGSKEYSEWLDRFVWSRVLQRRAGKSPTQKYLGSLSGDTEDLLNQMIPGVLHDLSSVSGKDAALFRHLEEKIPCPFVEAQIQEIPSADQPKREGQGKVTPGLSLVQRVETLKLSADSIFQEATRSWMATWSQRETLSGKATKLTGAVFARAA